MLDGGEEAVFGDTQIDASVAGDARDGDTQCGSIGSLERYVNNLGKSLDDPYVDVSQCSDGDVSVASGVGNKLRNFDHVGAQRAFSRSLAQASPSFMWESNSFLAAVFGRNDVVDELFKQQTLKRPAIDLQQELIEVEDEREHPLTKAFKAGVSKPFFMQALGRSSLENDEARRQTLIGGWTSLVITDVSAFNALDSMPVNASSHEQREFIFNTVTECMAGKATSTIAKRLGAMTKYANFCKYRGLAPFPLLEANLRAYMTSLVADKNTSASSGRSFLEAVRFSGAMLGLTGNRSMIVSQRVAGLAKTLTLRAQPILQASPLTIEQVGKLEKLCCSTDSLQDRVIIGGILIMVYGCARASDVARTIGIVLDKVDQKHMKLTGHSADPDGYIELSVIGHKGARSEVHRRTILPVVAPMISVSGHSWFDSWMEARSALELGVDGSIKFPLLPRFDERGVPFLQALQASEIGEYLRRTLGIDTASRNMVRSHSCKVTPLSWMAKFGISLPLRRNLGHHLDTAAKSAECYSRDAMAPALRALSKVVRQIALKRFFPDSTRSGRFVSQPSAADDQAEEELQDDDLEGDDVEDEDEEAERLAGDADPESGTDSSSDAGSVCAVEDHCIKDTRTLWSLIGDELRARLIDTSGDTDVWVHKSSSVLHLKQSNQNSFLCGRKVSERYQEHGRQATVECPRCKTCFSSKAACPDNLP